MTKAFEQIAAGLKDAIAFAQGDATKGRVVAGPDVKAIRAKTKLSQAKFASKLRVPVATGSLTDLTCTQRSLRSCRARTWVCNSTQWLKTS